MIYRSATQWRDAPRKKISFFGMSGLGKTYLSNMLRRDGWFHYSIDYRIGTHYMGEAITDHAIALAMREPTLRQLLRNDSIYIGSNISFDNLEPLSVYLGQPGNPDLGGLPFEEYLRRQRQHQRAEIAALLDTQTFAERATRLYGYDHFVCDSGGSICEVVNPEDADDPVIAHLRQNTLLIWLQGDPGHTQTLIDRFARAPKPMCYRDDVLITAWQTYLDEHAQRPDEVDPNAFATWAYTRAMQHREPRYAAIARHGITLSVDDVQSIDSPEAFNALVAEKLERR